MRFLDVFICFALIYPLHGLMQIRAFTCKTNDNICFNNNCSLTTVRKKISMLNFHCFFKEPQSHIRIHMKLFKTQRKIQQPFSIDIDEDFCRLIEKTSYSQLFLRLMPKIRKYSNFSPECPIIGNVSIVGLPLNLDFMPAAFAEGQYLLKIFVKDQLKNVSIVDINMDFNVLFFKNG